MALSDGWVDTRGISDEALSQRIYADRIDILVDLAGHTAKNRLLVFARRPAPIQVTWAGYVGSTGLSAMDYLIADNQHVPQGVDSYYSEKIIRLPESYICYEPPDYAPPVGPPPFRRNGYVTFGCFNNPAKINTGVLSAWTEILRSVPKSRLFLKYTNMDSDKNVKRISNFVSENGVSASRIRIENSSPHSELLACYNNVDIVLDTFPYSGGLTTCESLWMGVPVITLPGETFASRHSFGHLKNVGLQDLVSSDWPDYVSKAVELAQDARQLIALRNDLREQVAEPRLCDGKRFAEDFAAAMRQIWKDWCSGRP